MKHIIISFLILGSLIPLSAQEGEVLNKFDLRFGIVDNSNFLSYKNTRANLRLELDYNLSKFISLGTYIGYGQSIEESYSSLPSETKLVAQGYFYGINAYYHFSPHFLKPAAQTKFDLYLKGRLGGITSKFESSYVDEFELEEDGFFTRFDYGVYLGASYYPVKRVGLNAEIGYGKNYITKIGIAVKLGKTR
jgi:hypothetical protein